MTPTRPSIGCRQGGSCRTILLLLMVAVGLQPASAQEADVTATLDTAVQKMGDEIVRFVKSDSSAQGNLAVGTFTGPGPQNSGAGARIVASLRGHLRDKLQLVDTGAYSVTGEFLGQKRDGQFVTIIEASIKDSLGNRVHELRRKVITSLDEGVAFFGPSSVDLTAGGAAGDGKVSDPAQPTADPEASDSKDEVLASTSDANKPLDDAAERTNRVVDSIIDPELHLDGNVMKLSAQSPFGIEILIKSPEGYRTIPVSSEKGLAKVDIGPDQIYAVRLHNRSSNPVGARLTIDGINVFALSENPHFRGTDITMALCPCSKYLIKGWHLTDTHSAEFLVGQYGESAAAKLGVFEGVGTITARFFEATPRGPLPCAPCTKSKSFGTKAGNETEMQYSRLDVVFGKLLGSVSARYLKSVDPKDLPAE